MAGSNPTLALVDAAYVSRLRRDGNILVFHNQRGEFEPFKMLIGAVFALMVFTIIISAIQAFDDWRTKISVEKFYTGLQNAAKQPNGDSLVIEKVFFDKQAKFAANSIARRIGLQDGCVELRWHPGLTFTGEGTQLVTVNERIESNVYAKCFTNQLGAGRPECEISCIVSFGDPIN